MKINAEMDIPIISKHGPYCFFSHAYQPIIFRIHLEKIYINMSYIFHTGAHVRGKTIWICVASQTILIKSYWLGIERIACGHWAPDPSGSRSLLSSTTGFTGANLFNKCLARMLRGFDFDTDASSCLWLHKLKTRSVTNMMKACVHNRIPIRIKDSSDAYRISDVINAFKQCKHSLERKKITWRLNSHSRRNVHSNTRYSAHTLSSTELSEEVGGKQCKTHCFMSNLTEMRAATIPTHPLAYTYLSRNQSLGAARQF